MDVILPALALTVLAGLYNRAPVHDDATGSSSSGDDDYDIDAIDDLVEEGKLFPKNPFLRQVEESVRKRDEKQIFATWYDHKGQPVYDRTFAQIWDTAGTVAYHLRKEWGVDKGQHVILCYDFGLHFLEVFLGCLRAGVVATLVYPPGPPLAKSLTKLHKVIDDCNPVLILTDSRINTLRMLDVNNPFSKTRLLWDHGLVRYQVTDSLLGNSVLSSFVTQNTLAFDEATELHDIAFLQYTSGSTGDPKGVVVPFSALATNLEAANLGGDYAELASPFNQIRGLSWLPPYHDMGLICGNLLPFMLGFRMRMMSPISFIKNPLLWLKIMSQHRIQTTIAPDFSYQLVCKRFQESLARDRAKHEKEFANLDLSQIYSVNSAAEPCRVETVNAFSELFSPYGLPKDWYRSCYGLAEHVVFVGVARGLHLSTPRREDNEKVYVASIDFAELARQHPPPGLTLKIVDPVSGEEVADNQTGEIWISSGSVARCYHGKKQLSQETFGARLKGCNGMEFLRCGDLAFVQDGFVYICGRIKDLIICNGVNFYPQDIEFAVQDASPAVRPGCVAAFSSDESGKDGQLEIVFEIRKTDEADVASVCEAIRQAVMKAVGLAPTRISAIEERTICKTTSGKIQRRACRAALHEDSLRLVYDLHPFVPQHEPKVGGGKLRLEQARPRNFDGILSEFLGENFNQDCEWEELGLTSLAMVELQSTVADTLFVTLAPECFETYKTPRQLRNFVTSCASVPFETNLPPLQSRSRHELSWLSLSFFQAIGVILLLFAFAIPIIPAYYVGKVTNTRESVAIINLNDNLYKWMWLPLSVPTWMASFTILTVLTKWIVVGRYKEGEICIPSVAYARWWFFDRLLHLWEFWVGRFVLDTPLLWLFYYLMGAEIHVSAKLNAFVAEFDLLHIGPGVSLSHTVRCRKFGPWVGDEGPTIRFRPVVLEDSCRVEGLVSPGARIGKYASVARRAVVPEGAQVPGGECAAGNPAYSNGVAMEQTENPTRWMKLGFLKLLWLAVELYIFFSSLLIAQFIWNTRLPTAWRYRSVLHWFVLLATSSVTLVLFGVLLKWIMIGRRQPGSASDSLWRDAADWAADYHFRVSSSLLTTVVSGSIIWNIVLKMYGMDIDLASKVYVDSFPPSKVDLISVRRSFISIASFDTKKDDGTYHRTVVSESSLGYNVHVLPGVCISRSVVAPLSPVSKDIVKEKTDPRLEQCKMADLFFVKASIEVSYLLFVAAIWFTLIPSFELWRYVLEPQSAEGSVPVLALAIVLQTTIWLVLVRALQVTMHGFGCRSDPFIPVYVVYLTASAALQQWSMLPLLWGTPLFNQVVRLLGTRVEGQAIYFGRSLHDFHYTTLADKAVIDMAISCGHSTVFTAFQFGPNILSGVYHEMTFTAHHTGTKAENGPWRSLIGNIVSPEKEENI